LRLWTCGLSHASGIPLFSVRIWSVGKALSTWSSSRDLDAVHRDNVHVLQTKMPCVQDQPRPVAKLVMLMSNSTSAEMAPHRHLLAASLYLLVFESSVDSWLSRILVKLAGSKFDATFVEEWHLHFIFSTLSLAVAAVCVRFIFTVYACLTSFRVSICFALAALMVSLGWTLELATSVVSAVTVLLEHRWLYLGANKIL